MLSKCMKYALSLMVVGFLSAYGGSGLSSDGIIASADRGISSGSISSYGAVYVNGKRYDTSDVSVKHDASEPNGVTGLKLDMKAAVTIESNSQKAAI